MKKNQNIFVYIIMAIIIALLVVLAFLFFNKDNKSNDIVFNIKNSNIEIKIGDSTKIDYELNKELNINWKSDNPEVVTVNNGIITGKGLGSTIVHGTIINNQDNITRDIYISTYSGTKNIGLNEIEVPGEELFISKGSTYEIECRLNPIDSYITSIEYSSIDDDIASFTNGIITANNIGNTNVIITINKNITKIISVNVIEKQITPTYSKKVENVEIVNSEIKLKPGEKEEIKYNITPKDGYIENIKWESSDESIAIVNDGIITAKSSGETIIKLVINDKYTKEIKVMVSVPVSGISLKSKEKIVLKVGNSDIIETNIIPTNASNKKVHYASSSNVQIDENGKVVAIREGNGTITITTEDGNYKVEIPYVINPKTGIVNGDGGVWGYSTSRDQVPQRADISFFQNLVSNGKGTLSGDVYIYNDSKHSYKYNISKSILMVDNNESLTRIYYPKNVDLSMVNTFTTFAGTGPSVVNFGEFFNHLDKYPEDMKSSGIIILVSTDVGSRYEPYDAIYSTEFVKSIVDQKNGVKNAMGGYSGSGQYAGTAANEGQYDRLIICNSSFNSDKTTNLFNKEVTIFSPVGDFMVNHTTTGLNNMRIKGYTDVTVITNNGSLLKNSNYYSNFLMINPGTKMGNGHGYKNIINAKIFSYACR